MKYEYKYIYKILYFKQIAYSTQLYTMCKKNANDLLDLIKLKK